jgi:hypothetical protein
MFKQISIIAGAAAIALMSYALLPARAVDAAAPGQASRMDTQAQLIEVKVCPVTGEAVHGNGAGNEIVGKYKVYFCCGGCQPDFDKLTPEQKLQKAESAYKIQLASANTKTKTNASAETKPELIEVKVCPVMHSTVHGNGIGSEVVGKYKVYFCCKGCPEAFDKLTPAQKLQKAQEAYLIQQHNEEKKKEAHH